MDNGNNNKMEGQIDNSIPENTKVDRKLLVNIAVGLLVIVLGLVAVNQTLGYLYKAQFLKTPCELCKELNPEVEDCFNRRVNTYPTISGDWVDDLGNCYDLSGKLVDCKNKIIIENLNITSP